MEMDGWTFGQIDGLLPATRNSSALPIELRLFCINPSRFWKMTLPAKRLRGDDMKYPNVTYAIMMFFSRALQSFLLGDLSFPSNIWVVWCGLWIANVARWWYVRPITITHSISAHQLPTLRLLVAFNWTRSLFTYQLQVHYLSLKI